MIETNGTCEPIKSHFSCDNRICYKCSICGSILLKKQKEKPVDTYEPDGNPNIRYQWIHEEPAKSNKFRCSGCGNTAYYPQANNARKGGLRIPYEYCPFCGRHMITIWEGLK